jgi:hypothetical protein
MSASCAGKSDKTEIPVCWHVLPVTETGPWSCGYLEVEKGFKFPVPSNVVGYALFKSEEAPDLPKKIKLQLRCWITPDGSNEARLVDERILENQETQSWIGWKSFPLVSPASNVSNIRVNVKGFRKGTSLSGEVRSSEGFRFYSDRPQTAFNLAQRAVAAVIALMGSATDMVMILAHKSFWMIAGIFLSCPPLLLVPAAVVYFPWHVLGLDAAVYFPWHVPGLDAAVKAMALGSIAFAAGLLSPPLTSRHRSRSLLAPLQSTCDSHFPQLLVRRMNAFGLSIRIALGRLPTLIFTIRPSSSSATPVLFHIKSLHRTVDPTPRACDAHDAPAGGISPLRHLRDIITGAPPI